MLLEALLERAEGTLDKHLIPRLVVRALLLQGERGVAALAKLARDPDVPGSIYQQTILEGIYGAAHGHDPHMFLEAQKQCGGTVLLRPIASDTVSAARRALEDLFAELAVDPELFDRMLTYLGNQAQIGQLLDPFDRGEALDLLTRATIKLTPSLLDGYADLISRDLPEERYQEFLQEHPVFLDPLASQVIPKQRLGLEHATDFAIRRFDDRWLLVELEKPQTPILTAGNDFTAPFTHGLGQVIDFQRWVEENGAYAARHMPEVASPRGILVVGRRSQLAPEGISKLRRFAANSSTIDILTFDDVLVQARNLYENLRHR